MLLPSYPVTENCALKPFFFCLHFSAISTSHFLNTILWPDRMITHIRVQFNVTNDMRFLLCVLLGQF